jgi:hypothetical protein
MLPAACRRTDDLTGGRRRNRERAGDLFGRHRRDRGVQPARERHRLARVARARAQGVQAPRVIALRTVRRVALADDRAKIGRRRAASERVLERCLSQRAATENAAACRVDTRGRCAARFLDDPVPE